jgi:F-type H+-transporting ATPase subunit gamma
MPSLKDIRKRIVSVKSTQKITKAMKMVAGARLNRAQKRITDLRPYAVKTQEILSEITAEGRAALAAAAEEEGELAQDEDVHPLLDIRPERRVLLVVLTSDRGLCGSFNATITKLAEQQWRQREKDGQSVHMMVIGRKGRDYFARRGAPMEYIDEVWNDLDADTARSLGREVLGHFLRRKDPVDAIYLVYNEFKSAMTQNVVAERLLPVEAKLSDEHRHEENFEFLYEPSKVALLGQLAPMYLQISILRALYESMASELGARMTAMDSATTNATEMIDKLTLKYNRARQAAITTELMEIIGGSEALKG